MWHCECEQSIHVQQPRGLDRGGKVLALALPRPRPRLFSQGQGQGQGQGLRCKGQGQGQDLHEVSSRILEAKARPRGQQDWLRVNIDWKSAISLQRGTVDPKFKAERVARTNHSSSQKTRLSDLSYGLTIWTDLSFVSHYPRVWQTDRHLVCAGIPVPCSAVIKKMILPSQMSMRCWVISHCCWFWCIPSCLVASTTAMRYYMGRLSQPSALYHYKVYRICRCTAVHT